MSAGVTLNFTLTDSSGTPTQGKVVFTLVNCGSTPPVVTGTSVIAQKVITAFANSSGVGSVTLWGNYQLTPTNTYYTVAFYPANANIASSTTSYLFSTGGTFDLSNIAPLSAYPGAPVSVVSFPLSVAQGGTGTATPSLVAGTNVTITGSFPNQTINSSGGGGTVAPVTKTSSYVTSIANVEILMNSASATTVTLTTASLPSGWVYRVKNINTGVVTVTPASGTLDGAASQNLSLQNQSFDCLWDGTNFWIL